MNTFQKRLASFAAPLIFGISMIFVFQACSQPNSPQSPNGKYQALLVGVGNDRHYQIREVKTDSVILTTTAEYPTPNDAKAGMFSPDSKEFAVAYHYGHAGSYTYIGVWDLENAKLVRTERINGWIRDISFVFKK